MLEPLTEGSAEWFGARTRAVLRVGRTPSVGGCAWEPILWTAVGFLLCRSALQQCGVEQSLYWVCWEVHPRVPGDPGTCLHPSPVVTA